MSNALKTLEDKYGAQVVGGQIIAVLDGVHTDLGVLNHDTLVLNEVGQKLLKVAPLDHDGDTARGGSRKGRRSAEPAPAPAPAPAPEAEPASEVGVEHTVEIEDSVTLEDQIG